MVLGPHLLGEFVSEWPHCQETYLIIDAGLPARSSFHRSNDRRRDCPRRKKTCPTSHRAREEIAHFLGVANSALLYGLSESDALHQLAIFIHSHPGHYRILGLALLLHNHE